MSSIPKLNKKISDFFIGEEGSISKDKLIKTGIIIAGVAVSAGVVKADTVCGVTAPAGQSIHANDIKLEKMNMDVKGTHCNGISTTAAPSGGGGKM